MHDDTQGCYAITTLERSNQVPEWFDEPSLKLFHGPRVPFQLEIHHSTHTEDAPPAASLRFWLNLCFASGISGDKPCELAGHSEQILFTPSKWATQAQAQMKNSQTTYANLMWIGFWSQQTNAVWPNLWLEFCCSQILFHCCQNLWQGLRHYWQNLF